LWLFVAAGSPGPLTRNAREARSDRIARDPGALDVVIAVAMLIAGFLVFVAAAATAARSPRRVRRWRIPVASVLR